MAKVSLSEHSPHLVAEWHLTKNGNLTPYCVSYGSNKKVWWICKDGHEQLLTVTDTEYNVDRTATPIKVMSFLQEQSS